MQRTRIVALAFALLAPVAAAADTLERIADDGVLRIGYRETAVPFSYADPETGAPAGYSVALCEAIAEEIAGAAGVNQVELSFVPVSAAGRFDALVQGEIDLLCGAATQTLSRRARVDFSIPTFVDGAGIALKRDGARSFDDLAGGKVAVVGGTTTEEAIMRMVEEQEREIEVVVVADHNAGLEMLRSDEVQAYLADRAILQFLVANSGAEDIVVASDQLTIETHALALPRGDSGLRLAVDRGLSRLYLSGEVDVLFAESFGEGAEMTELLLALYRLTALPR